MRIRHIAVIGFTALTIVLAVVYTRTTAKEARLRQDFSIAAGMNIKDLGSVALRSDTPKRVSLGKDRDLTITATVLTNDLLQMNLVYEAKEEIIDGKPVTKYSERSQFQLRPGMRCAPRLGQHLVVVMKPTVMQ